MPMGVEWIDAPTVGDAELELLDALGLSPLTVAELAAVLGRERDHVATVADRLLAAGLVQSEGPGELRFTLTSAGIDAGIAGIAGLHEPGERAAVITPYRDGPLVVRGPFRMVDQDGEEIEVTRGTVALCRCGRSRLRPFCDGSHKLTRFKAPSGAENRQRHLTVAPPPR
jgi:CDGSH-type Zn-finger protein